ncbi:MAG: ankyrin repeat domain-containing protein [Verrucomicrobia bacterium]|nr:ankyrin repeat domain-containing protein [Verrucomicrobiota bacterium]MBS0636872.1 ankyrin repeat domain-containing protein [Verrucomicrobiota bacterium]
MTKITNSDSLNKYYTDTVAKETGIKKSDKTRLIVVGDHLEARKLSFFERIGALFGGKASFKKVAEFCTDHEFRSKSFAESVTKYNKTHPKAPAFYVEFTKGNKGPLQPELKKAFINDAIEHLKTDKNPDHLNKLLAAHAELKDDLAVSGPLYEALQDAIKSKNLDLARSLLAHCDETAILCTACNKGDLDAVKGLHQMGVDLNKPDTTKMTPLMFAASQGHSKVVAFLLEKNVDNGAKILYSGDALQQASQGGHREVVGVILNHPSTKVTHDRLLELATQFPTLRKEICKSAAARKLEGDKSLLFRVCTDRTIPHREELAKKLIKHGGDEVLGALDHAPDLIELFENYGSEKVAEQLLRRVTDRTAAELKAKQKKVWDLPKISEADSQRIENAVLRNQEKLDQLSQKERSNLLFTIARSSMTPTRNQVDAITKGFTDKEFFNSLTWLKAELTRLGDDDELKEPVIHKGKMIMQAASSVVTDRMNEIFAQFKA